MFEKIGRLTIDMIGKKILTMIWKSNTVSIRQQIIFCKSQLVITSYSTCYSQLVTVNHAATYLLEKLKYRKEQRKISTRNNMQFILVDMIIIYISCIQSIHTKPYYYILHIFHFTKNSKSKNYETYNRGEGSFDKPNLNESP